MHAGMRTIIGYPRDLTRRFKLINASRCPLHIIAHHNFFMCVRAMKLSFYRILIDLDVRQIVRIREVPANTNVDLYVWMTSVADDSLYGSIPQ